MRNAQLPITPEWGIAFDASGQPELVGSPPMMLDAAGNRQPDQRQIMALLFKAREALAQQLAFVVSWLHDAQPENQARVVLASGLDGAKLASVVGRQRGPNGRA